MWRKRMNKKVKRILAIIAIILILGMYVLTMIFAFGKSPETQSLFLGALGCTILVPVFLWFFFRSLDDRHKKDE